MEKTDPSIVLEAIHSELMAVCSEKMREGQSRYFKEKIKFLGCSLPQCSKIAGKWAKRLKDERCSHDDILTLAEELLKAGSWEEGAIALELVARRKSEFRERDFSTFERWLSEYINNWGHTDSIAPHIFGELVERYPNLTERTFKWTKSPNRWMRRASAVTYVLHAKHGRFHDIVYKTADALLGDDDDMVRKGVGWMLKCTSQADEKGVVEYLMNNRNKTSRLVLRYATEKVSPANRSLVLGRS
jgi:3-methyladenine DNA glycosylase AlkD